MQATANRVHFDDPSLQAKYEQDRSYERGTKEATRRGIHWLLAVFIPCLLIIVCLAGLLIANGKDASDERATRKVLESRLAAEVAQRSADIPRATKWIDKDDLFIKSKSIHVILTGNEDALKLLAMDELTTKFELTLRRHNVSVGSSSDAALVEFRINLLPVANTSAIFWTTRSFCRESMIIQRPLVGGDTSYIVGELALDGHFGLTDTKALRGKMLEFTENYAENVANKFLAAREKYK